MPIPIKRGRQVTNSSILEGQVSKDTIGLVLSEGPSEGLSPELSHREVLVEIRNRFQEIQLTLMLKNSRSKKGIRQLNKLIADLKKRIDHLTENEGTDNNE